MVIQQARCHTNTMPWLRASRPIQGAEPSSAFTIRTMNVPVVRNTTK